jgi:hypothetical protein
LTRAGFIADFGGEFRFGTAARGGPMRQAPDGKDGTIDGLVIRAGAASPSRLARPATALRV